MTTIKIMNLASATCGVLGTLILFYFAYEQPGGLQSIEGVLGMRGRNLRRRWVPSLGLGLIMASFLLQGVAVMLDD
jgi:hypothetical protein